MTTRWTTHCHTVRSHVIILRESSSLTQERTFGNYPAGLVRGRHAAVGVGPLELT